MRSLKKGPFIDRSLLRSVEKINTELEKLLSGGQTPLIPSADAGSLGSNSGIADKEASLKGLNQSKIGAVLAPI